MSSKVMFLSILFFSLAMQPVSGYWLNMRNSSVTPDSLIYIRYESSKTEEADHSLKYFNGLNWQALVPDTLTIKTFQAAVPYDNQSILSLSFRVIHDSTVVFSAGYLETATPYSLDKMTLIKDYSLDGDIVDHLNINAESIVLTEDRINFALTNFGGGFPVRESLLGPFYSYTVSFWHTDKEEPEYVYALIRTVNLPPFISTGLYKIDPSDDSMELLGDINYEVNEEENTLFLSCDISDLLADEDFAKGFQQENSIYIGSMTQKIEDFGNVVTVQDQGQYHLMFLDEFNIEPFVNTTPKITDVKFEDFGDYSIISMTYIDLEGHFPILAEVITDNNTVYTLVPEKLNFKDPVAFSCKIYDEWSWAEIRISDNNSDIIKVPVHFTLVQSQKEIPDVSLNIYPNPYYMSANLAQDLHLDVETKEDSFFNYEILNIKGQSIYRSPQMSISEGTSRQIIPADKIKTQISAGGVYFIRTKVNNHIYTIKFLLIK